MNLRKVEVLIDNEWQDVRLQDVKAGQRFRMFEDGAQISHAGFNTFLADSDGFFDNGVGTINAK